MNRLNAWKGEYYFLNLRFLLIVCVFVGNAIEPLVYRMPGLHALYVWIFTFHMPLFVFATGYFARHNRFGESGRRLMLQIALQYVIFQSLYSVLDLTLFKVAGIHHSFFVPYLLLWFLASHLFWRLITILMRKWPPLLQLAVSTLLGIAIGYANVDGTWFSLSRTFVYLPFFVAGLHFSADLVVKIFTSKIRYAALSVSAVLLAAAAVWGNHLPVGWLYGSMTYSQLGQYTWYAGLLRLGMYALQLCASAAFLSLVPMRECRMTDWGRRTLYVFLLHGLIVRFAAVSPLYAYIHTPLSAASLVLSAALLTVLLCQPAIRRITSPVIEPPVEWLFSLTRRFRTVHGVRMTK
ncbi:acyltransferase family protein [Paenibacillus caui]|uniref:acyltransferase family protein n=1 Tax=Paenibacillus caui TaxID=2873927 RepID=UPI001CA87BE1|nr:fucose 4-O-acetylase [Paenibacillus caui]